MFPRAAFLPAVAKFSFFDELLLRRGQEVQEGMVWMEPEAYFIKIDLQRLRLVPSRILPHVSTADGAHLSPRLI